MNKLNQIIIDGIVSKEPSFGQTLTGLSYCLVQITITQKYKETIESSDFDVLVYASEAVKSIKVGDAIRCIGKLKQNKWVDSTGKKHSGVQIIAEAVNKIK